jgi:hypothetical protein
LLEALEVGLSTGNVFDWDGGFRVAIHFETDVVEVRFLHSKRGIVEQVAGTFQIATGFVLSIVVVVSVIAVTVICLQQSDRYDRRLFVPHRTTSKAAAPQSMILEESTKRICAEDVTANIAGPVCGTHQR